MRPPFHSSIALASFATLAMACGPRTVPADDARADAADVIEIATLDVQPDIVDAPDVPAAPDIIDAPIDVRGDRGTLPSDTLVFVASQLTIDVNDVRRPSAGLNLDGLFSGMSDAHGCNVEDYFSDIDRDQNLPSGCDGTTADCHGGVDNQLPVVCDLLRTVSGMDARILLGEAVANNRLVYIVRVNGIDDIQDDDHVTVSIYRGYPTFATACTSVLPDREYVIARESITTGGTTLDDARLRIPGRIVGGRLMADGAAGDVLELPFPAMIAGGTPSVIFHAPRVRFDISVVDGVAGVLAGSMPGREFVEAFASGSSDVRAILEGPVASLVDIEIDGICDDNSMSPRRFGAISMGLGANLVRATVRPMDPIVDAAPMTVCGN